MAKLSAICMKIDYFKRIVSTKRYECYGKSKYHLEDEPEVDRKRKIKQREVGEYNAGYKKGASTPNQKL